MRKPKDFIGERRVIINVGSETKPNWTYTTDVSGKDYEYARKQFCLINYDKPESFTNNKILINTFQNMNLQTQENFMNLNSLNVSYI